MITQAIPILCFIASVPPAGDLPLGPLVMEREIPRDPYRPHQQLPGRPLKEPTKRWARGPFTSIQVNVDSGGNNIIGDAANEPSIAISPANPNNIVIAWRQFDTVQSNFRQAGVAYSNNRGQNWTKFTLDPGQFRSDPVMGADGQGRFFFSSLSSVTSAQMFRSLDNGVNWTMVDAFGGDKQWIAVDERTSGQGAGHIYQHWSGPLTEGLDFTRSISHGASFQNPIQLPKPPTSLGTIDTGPDGTVYLTGVYGETGAHYFKKSPNARNPTVTPTFEPSVAINLGGETVGGTQLVNPVGLLGQVWIAADNSTGFTRGNLYISGTISNTNDINPANVHFIRSVNDGQTWSDPVIVNDDVDSGAWHWFGTMSVAPNGRIDIIWNDTRNAPPENSHMSEVFYTHSLDAGYNWAPSVPVTPAWNPHLGYPQQQKIGDYYHMVSDNGGASLAYAATFNGEEDVFFLRIPRDCDANGIEDDCDIACGAVGTRCDVPGCGLQADCNFSAIPDSCEPDEDCNGNTVRDICDIGAATSGDCNGNNVPDECEPSVDCNSNGFPDACDLGNGTSEDCNGNSIPDECDLASGKSEDANEDGVLDECQGACCSCTSCVNTTPALCAIVGPDFSGLGKFCGEPDACVPRGEPENSTCETATVLPSLPFVQRPFDSRCATEDFVPGAFCPGPVNLDQIIWFHYTAPCAGSIELDVCNADFDSLLAVYTGNEPPCRCPDETGFPGAIACDDDACGMVEGPSRVTFNATAGVCYSIRVAGRAMANGTGTLRLTYNSFCTVPPAPQPESSFNKTRFLSFRIPNATVPADNTVAIRVALDSLHHVDPLYTGGPSVPFSAFEGQVRWVGPPQQYTESSSNPASFYASSLQCSPHYREWNTLNMFHVTGTEIVPSSEYQLQTYPADCQGAEATCSRLSPPVHVRTTRWGDMETPFNPPSPTVQPDISDVSALVDKFRNGPGAPTKARGLLAGEPGNPFGEITSEVLSVDFGFSHISACVDAFRGVPYPYTIQSCP